MADVAPHLFVSDLHLHPARPGATDCFLRFLDREARSARALYILGDLFEAWVGDDAALPHDETVMTALSAVAAAGVAGYFLPGNRDFLINERFLGRTGFRLLPDEAALELPGERVLLMHGDTLCTDDLAYQRFRHVVRNSTVQAAFLALPAAARRRIGRWTRDRSMAANAGKSASIMDVNRGAVVDAMNRHGVRTLIHGHTHRPAVHSWQQEGVEFRRIVLGDWYEQGSVLQWGADGPELTTRRFT